MITVPAAYARVQNADRPFTVPFNTPPGPTTWLLGQQFGNTSGAFNFGRYWYAAGQGLHFGIDFNAPCGTPVVAIADGEVDQVDNFSFGLLPHNLTIFHRDLGYTSLYGHLLKMPDVKKGQKVTRGQVVAISGDPDGTCVSRPHLHLEVRSRDYHIAHNPAPLIDTDWSMLSSIGGYNTSGFTKDLYNPNRWQTIFDQPDVTFNQNRLNNFAETWLPLQRYQPPPLALSGFTAPAPGTPTFRRLTDPGCCSMAWWAPDSRAIRFWNGPENKRAAIMAVPLTGGSPQPSAASPIVSPDGQYEVRVDNGRTDIIHVADQASRALKTGGSWPRFSPNSSKLLWQWSPGDNVPGTNPPATEIWVSNLDGTALESVGKLPGASVYWLDDDRVLISQRQGVSNVWTLSIYTLSTRQTTLLYTGKNIRSVTAAPGGKWIVYYRPFQDDANVSGMYVLETTPGANPAKLPFFGSWRWRDSSSLIYTPFEVGKPLTFVLYDVQSGQSRPLTNAATQPIGMLNGEWSLSPDGQNIVFWNVKDSALWLMSLAD